MDAYELISPLTGKPCGVFACGKCNLVTPKSLVDKCCVPCKCGKPSRNRFEEKCSDCWRDELNERRLKLLEEATLVEWDGESMILSEGLGYRDGWFESPEALLDYLADEESESVPEFAFVGEKCVRSLDIGRAIEALTEDTYEDAELHVADEDMAELQAAVDKFNAKYSVVYFEPNYKTKVRIVG